jgi:uncharacterized protein (UPF0335 family)
MSGYQVSKSYNPFLMDKSQADNKNESVYILDKHKINDFSERLNELLTEKSALKIDYHEIQRDLKSFGFPIKATQATDYNSGLDTVRLKAGLKVMDLSFRDLHKNENNIDQSQDYFQKEVCKVFEILSRDYKRLSEFFSTKLQDNQKLNLPELENQLQNHIKFYNHFTGLLENYLNYMTGMTATAH